jgi:hypothetical protein
VAAVEVMGVMVAVGTEAPVVVGLVAVEEGVVSEMEVQVGLVQY